MHFGIIPLQARAGLPRRLAIGQDQAKVGNAEANNASSARTPKLGLRHFFIVQLKRHMHGLGSVFLVEGVSLRMVERHSVRDVCRILSSDSLRSLRGFESFHLNPLHPKLVAKPSHLSFGITSRVAFPKFDVFFKNRLVFQSWAHLFVAQALQRSGVAQTIFQ